MSKRAAALLLSVLLLAIALATRPGTAYTVDSQQTVPSRTPTAEATATAGSDNTPQPTEPANTPPPGDTPPPPGDTPPPDSSPTATSTAAVTLAPTPEGGFLPTAEACSLNPTAQAFSKLNVRSGPGSDYDQVGRMNYLEVRPVIGRTAFAPWWQVMLVDGTIGWVADEFVVVTGYTGALPYVDAPPLPNGSTPTPGPRWEPTPNPICTPPPTPTASATPAPTSTASPSPQPPTQAPAGADSSPTASPSPSDTPSPAASSTPLPSFTPTSALTSTPLPTAEPLPVPPAQSSGLGWLPIIGAVILVGAAIVLLARRR